MENITLLWTK